MLSNILKIFFVLIKHLFYVYIICIEHILMFISMLSVLQVQLKEHACSKFYFNSPKKETKIIYINNNSGIIKIINMVVYYYILKEIF